MKTRMFVRPTRLASWNDRVMPTVIGVATARELNTNICPNCGCGFLHDRVCSCQMENETLSCRECNAQTSGYCPRHQQEELEALQAIND